MFLVQGDVSTVTVAWARGLNLGPCVAPNAYVVVPIGLNDWSPKFLTSRPLRKKVTPTSLGGIVTCQLTDISAPALMASGDTVKKATVRSSRVGRSGGPSGDVVGLTRGF